MDEALSDSPFTRDQIKRTPRRDRLPDRDRHRARAADAAVLGGVHAVALDRHRRLIAGGRAGERVRVNNTTTVRAKKKYP